MTASKLSRMLALFREVEDPISLGYIAQQLEITPQMAESMLDFWIRKGRIRQASQPVDCGGCGINGSCPYIYQLPISYQLVEGDGSSGVR